VLGYYAVTSALTILCLQSYRYGTNFFEVDSDDLGPIAVRVLLYVFQFYVIVLALIGIAYSIDILAFLCGGCRLPS